MIILGIDPGKSNTAFATVRFGFDPKIAAKRHRVLKLGMLDLGPTTPLEPRLICMRRAINDLLKVQKPDVVFAERFVYRRGRGRGNSGEYINLFLGILYEACVRMRIKVMFVTSGVHKQWMQRTYGSTAQERWPQIIEHEADALGLILYGVNHYLRG